MIPKAILLDLDDTIIAYDHGIDVDGCWRSACGRYFQDGDEQLTGIIDRIKEQARWFWSDPERHRTGRHDLDLARTAIISAALQEAGCADLSIAGRIAVEYGVERDRALNLYEGAIDALEHLRARGIKLALITNGGAKAQRGKIERFGLAPYFDCILIEGEFGTGKPEQAVYMHALKQLNVEAGDAWMIGDNFEWEIAAPQKLAIKGVWINPKGLERPSDVMPFKTLASLSEIRGVLDELAR